MKKNILFLIVISLFLNTFSLTYADVFDGMMEMDNSILFETNALDMSQMGTSFDMTLDATLPDISPILLPETMDDLLLNNNDLNPSIEIDTTFDDMTLDLNETVNDLNDITDFNMDSLDNMFEANTDNIEILEGEIISPETDASGDFDPSNDFPTNEGETEDSDGDGEPGNDGPEEDEDGDESAFLFDVLFSNVIYADEIEEKTVYYLRTEDTSYVLNSNDNYINYFITLIANKNITVQLTVEKNSAISVNVAHLYAVDEIPDAIWEKYTDFCSEELKKELPYGVFFTKENNYYFTETKTDTVIKVKTDEPELEILIPLIANKGIQVAINYSEIDKETIYITDVILLEDLPEDIAKEYVKQYKEYEKTILYNFTGYLKTVDGYYCIVTDYGTFKLSSEIENILTFIVLNTDTELLVKIHGYLDSENMTINVIQIDY